MYASFCLSSACPKIHRSASCPSRKDAAPGSMEVGPSLAEDVALVSEEVALGLAASCCLLLAYLKLHRPASCPPQEDVAPGSVEVAPS